jgi:hypothetical protein
MPPDIELTVTIEGELFAALREPHKIGASACMVHAQFIANVRPSP